MVPRPQCHAAAELRRCQPRSTTARALRWLFVVLARALKVFPVAAVYGRQIALLTVVASLTAVFALLLVPFIRIATCEAQQVCTHCDCSMHLPALGLIDPCLAAVRHLRSAPRTAPPRPTARRHGLSSLAAAASEAAAGAPGTLR